MLGMQQFWVNDIDFQWIQTRDRMHRTSRLCRSIESCFDVDIFLAQQNHCYRADFAVKCVEMSQKRHVYENSLTKSLT